MTDNKNVEQLVSIDLHNYIEGGSVFNRTAVRAIIEKDGKIALIKSNKYGDYKIPGGGMENGETFEDTLVREVQEETGLDVIISSINYIGFAKEKRKGITSDICIMISHYYSCAVTSTLLPRHLDDYESAYGYDLVWIDPATAVRHNQAIIDQNNCDATPWIVRDTAVLEKLYLNTKQGL